MEIEMEMLKREVAEKIYSELFLKHYQDSERQDLEELADEAIYAANVFAQKYTQVMLNAGKDKAIASSWTK